MKRQRSMPLRRHCHSQCRYYQLYTMIVAVVLTASSSMIINHGFRELDGRRNKMIIGVTTVSSFSLMSTPVFMARRNRETTRLRTSTNRISSYSHVMLSATGHDSQTDHLQFGGFDEVPYDVPSLKDGPKILRTDDGRDIVTHIRLVDQSLRQLTGRGVVERMMIDMDEEQQSLQGDRLYEMVYLNNRYVLITHGTEADPIYNFANRAACTAFWRSYDDVVQLPSARSVVLQSDDEAKRIELMKAVTNQGYVEGATGIRVRDDGRFIKLVDAVVWNVVDNDGTRIGQAAFFDRSKCPILDSIE